MQEHHGPDIQLADDTEVAIQEHLLNEGGLGADMIKGERAVQAVAEASSSSSYAPLSNVVPMWSEKDDDQNIDCEPHSDSELPFVVGRKVVIDCFATTRLSRGGIPR